MGVIGYCIEVVAGLFLTSLLKITAIEHRRECVLCLRHDSLQNVKPST
jgi:hypothetical protein